MAGSEYSVFLLRLIRIMHIYLRLRDNKDCCYFKEGGVTVANRQNEASKADVQSTELNKFPASGEADTEFSAEEAAEAFQENQSSGTASEEQE